MRLWHESLIPYLPNKQLLGQHRECCALRGNGWGKKHSTVDYIFLHRFEYLYNYHMKVIEEMKIRNYNVDNVWLDSKYRGKKCEPYKYSEVINYSDTIYEEHNKRYLIECIRNLEFKNTKPFNYSNWEEIENILIKK